MFTIACCIVVGLGLWLNLVSVDKLLCPRICATIGCNCHTARCTDVDAERLVTAVRTDFTRR